MSTSRNLLVNVAFSAALAFSLLVCAFEPLAVKLSFSGSWLFLWPLAFWAVRCLAFFIFPFIAALLAYLAIARRAGNRAPRVLALSNIVGCVLIAGAVLIVEHWNQAWGMAWAKSHPEAFPPGWTNSGAGTLPRQVGSVPVLTDIDGRSVDLNSRIRDARLTAIIFWASYDVSWSPNLEIAEVGLRDFGGQGLQVFAIDEQEAPETVRSYVRSHNFKVPVLLDPDRAAFRSFGLLGGVEQILLVSPNANIVASLGNGFTGEQRAWFTNAVSSLLSSNSQALK